MCAKDPLKAETGFASDWAGKGAPSETPDTSKNKPTIETGRAKVFAPEGEMIVYRAEKKERQTLETRRAQGGLNIWKPSSTNAQDAFANMLAKITQGKDLDEAQLNNRLKDYSRTLIAQGQEDNLATARTIEGAYTSNFNYTIRIPNVRLFKWAPDGIGDRIPPGAEITLPYIVLNADTVAASTIFAFGHVAGTQEVSFYTHIPGKMITCVGTKSFTEGTENF